MHVIPAILEKDFGAIKKKIELVKPYVPLVHLDVMDNKFVPNETFNDLQQIADLGMNLSLHLMVQEPSNFFLKHPKIQRIIIHQEIGDFFVDRLKLIWQMGKEVGLAINPKTEIAPKALDLVDVVLIMGVTPGFSGQKFDRSVLNKMAKIKKMKPNLLVGIDGGVDDKIGPTGADFLVSCSYIFKGDIKKNIKTLANFK